MLMIEQIRDLGKKIGLAAVGIAPAVDEAKAFYPWGKSVIVAAMSYLPPNEPTTDGCRGLVARFARSVDYHRVMRNKLVILSETLSQYTKNIEICVDTNPLPERKLAILAGIAQRGKNSCVYVDGYGSWVCLGEIVTDIQIIPKVNKNIDICKDCDICVRACPTGAITSPYKINPALCLSQITQSGGIIKLGIRRLLENRVYGCDICQEVCPINKDIKSTSMEFGQRVFPGAYPELKPLICMSKDYFEHEIKHSSIGWIGRTRIRRNAALAVGNGADARRPCTDANWTCRAHPRRT